MGKIARNYETSFEDMESLFSISNEDFVTTSDLKKESILSKADSYLQKGEKLLTLAKEHFIKICSNLQVSNFEERFYDLNFVSADEDSFSHMDGILVAATKLIRRVLRSAESLDDVALSHVLSTIKKFYQIELDLASEPVKFSLLYEKKTVKLTLVEEGFLPLVVYGLKDNTHPKNAKNVLLKTGVCVGDIATILATLYLFSIVTDYVKEMPCERPSETLPFMLLSYHSGYGRVFSKEDTYRDAKDVFSMKWIVPSDQECLFKVWEDIFTNHECSVVHSSQESSEIFKDISIKIQEGHYAKANMIPLVFNDTAVRLLSAFMPVESALSQGRISYLSLLSSHSSGSHWPLINYFLSGYKWERVVLVAFKKVYEEKHGQVEALKTLKELDSEHAKSYQTKKNIPQQTLTAMESSSFNNYFGYVEFDEDVDLEAVEVLADEFLAFKETHFSFIDLTQNSLRFRRLGNHKALGLYYPNVKCLCVDIHSPSSFIHEFGHLIDYCYGNLSIKPEFSYIRMSYESRLKSYIREDSGFAAIMNGKSKYNLNYYLKPTEVFARCFEIYCVKVLNIHNSLVHEAFGMEYPADEIFVEQVKHYFEDCFDSLIATSKLSTGSKAATCIY